MSSPVVVFLNSQNELSIWSSWGDYELYLEREVVAQIQRFDTQKLVAFGAAYSTAISFSSHQSALDAAFSAAETLNSE